MTLSAPDRRTFLGSLLAGGGFYLLPGLAAAAGKAATPGIAAAEPFSWEGLKDLARDLARRPWQAPELPDAPVLDRITYDFHNQIRFREEHTLWAGQGSRPPVQPFFPGTYFRQPVRLFAVEDGLARELGFDLNLFDIPEGNPAHELNHTEGFAGFRVQDPETRLDWMAFLGASYWRTSGYTGQFGLSVRGLAIDSGMHLPEEFPMFTRFWLEPGENGEITAYALLESPRATGAYRIASVRGAGGRPGIVQEVSATLFLRGDMERLGIAPLTSMYWFGKNNSFIAPDWRPEVHDSDGLEIHAANGERIWRPLNNPPRTMANSFLSPGVKGFGLMQRERSFEQYQDDGVFYEKRASVFVEPSGDWGDGAVTLIELRTDDEIHDNIVAMWTPSAPARAGQEYDLHYRLNWLEDAPVAPQAARFTATRLGAGGIPGQPRPPKCVKITCDLENLGLETLDRTSGVTVDVSSSAGVLSNTSAYPVVGTKRWRAMADLDFSALAEGDDSPIDLRLCLRQGEQALSETLILQLFPSQLNRLLAARA